MKTKKPTQTKNHNPLPPHQRTYPPPPQFTQQAHIKNQTQYRKLYQQSIDDPQTFWAQQALRHLHWHKPWKTILQWNPPHAQWFQGGKLNASHNCLDRHLQTHRANKAAIIWEGEPTTPTQPPPQRTLTYRQLHQQVNLLANTLKQHNIKPRDRIIIYLPLLPEAAIAILACARIGAIHSVVFAGFSPQALTDRIQDSAAKMIITADGGWRRGKIIPLKNNVDQALKNKQATKTIQTTIILQHTHQPIKLKKNRDHWWHQTIQNAKPYCPPTPLNSEHPLFILYTSGSTGKPKGILHTTAGYLLSATLTTKYIFDIQDTDTYWCTADIGWITGHTYLIYGPLSNGATTLMYEGAPNYPTPDRLWQIIDRHQVTTLYTAPTAIRALMKEGTQWPKKHKLNTLRLLGTVGEPINPKAWLWYHTHIGKKHCPIVDTWWQTETGAIMISPIPGATPTTPGTATQPFLGIQPAIIDDHGNPLPKNTNGKLIIQKPWPSMLRGIWNDPKRYQQTYWNHPPHGTYLTGDGARQDQHGNYWITGRIDDVLNISGHRIGTAEIENALVQHNTITEAAVVGTPHPIKGQALAAFITLKNKQKPTTQHQQTIRSHIAQTIGPFAKPDQIHYTDTLPKTRSGKIIRRLLKQIAAGKKIQGDTTTLEDHTTLTKLTQQTKKTTTQKPTTHKTKKTKPTTTKKTTTKKTK